MLEQEVELQVKQTEERGQRIVNYLDMYKGTNLYNEIALAIEFGFKLGEEYYNEKITKMNDLFKNEKKQKSRVN